MSCISTSGVLGRGVNGMVGRRGVNPPAFSPLDLEPLVWLDAAQEGYGEHDEVESFADRSGNGNDFSQGTSSLRPLMVLNGINGLPAVESDGVDDELVCAAFGAHATWWAYLVVRPWAAPNSKTTWCIVDYPASVADYRLLETTHSSNNIGYNNAGGGLFSLPYVPDTDYALHLKGSGNLSYLANHLGGVISNSNSNSRVDGAMRLFNRGDAGQAASIRIGELIFGSGTLTTDHESAVQNYLGSKWGTIFV